MMPPQDSCKHTLVVSSRHKMYYEHYLRFTSEEIRQTVSARRDHKHGQVSNYNTDVLNYCTDIFKYYSELVHIQ